MSRRKLSEYRAKTLLAGINHRAYEGVTLDATTDWPALIDALDQSRRYAVKVDQAIKGRFKKGLVKLELTPAQVRQWANRFFAAGYQYCLVEPYDPHGSSDERYLQLERRRDGIYAAYSQSGGIDIENQAATIVRRPFKGAAYKEIAAALALPTSWLKALGILFVREHMVFLEINPLISKGYDPLALDAAVEVDDAAVPLVEGWGLSDIRALQSNQPQERAVQALSEGSQASLMLRVVNPDGSIFMLLSGGGASVVLADEVHNLGFGRELANYGEYSGNPSYDEVYAYTEQILELLVDAKAARKVLIIGGGVANFTDIRTTFKAIIAALRQHEASLRQQEVRLYVRRGGPHETEGLALMSDYLQNAGLYGMVAGPELLLTDVVAAAVAELTGVIA